MAYEVTVTQRSTYLHFIITGHNSKDTIVRYVDEIHRECIAHKCFRVLIEERLDGPRLSIMDVFELAQNVSSRGRGIFKAIAYVDINAIDDSMKFAEDACVNRSLPMAVFSNVPDAEKWLMKKGHPVTKPDTDKQHR
jgi:hypothetical protein